MNAAWGRKDKMERDARSANNATSAAAQDTEPGKRGADGVADKRQEPREIKNGIEGSKTRELQNDRAISDGDEHDTDRDEDEGGPSRKRKGSEESHAQKKRLRGITGP